MNWRARVAILPALVVLGASCHRPRTYDTEVTVSRVSPVRKDDQGHTVTMDVEFNYSQCPGTQIEVVRGDAAFAVCMSKYAVGARVPIRIEHAWGDAGRYTATVQRIGDCDRVRDPNDEASYSLARDCRDWTIHDARVGFQCTLEPSAELLKACPWFRRR